MNVTTFLSDAAKQDRFGRDERDLIVRQALVLLEQVFAHLPQARARRAFDPVQRLRSMRARLLTGTDGAGSDLEFHRTMLRVFGAVSDIHTSYRLPAPYASVAAALPLIVEACGSERRPRYVVTRLAPNAAPCGIAVGDELTHWNATPVRAVVEQLADQQPGSTETVRRALAVNSLTIRPLVTQPAPEESSVVLTCRRGRSPAFDVTLQWQVLPVERVRVWRGERAELLPRSVHHTTEYVRRVKYASYVAPSARTPRAFSFPGGGRLTVAPLRIPPALKGLVRAAELSSGGTTCGYLRLFTFDVSPSAQAAFVPAVRALLGQLAAPELIVDVRGNSGGLISLAECTLQLLTPDPIEPVRAEFLSSDLTLRLVERFSTADFRGTPFDLSAWQLSLRQSVDSSAPHSRAFPLTSREELAELRASSRRKLLLIVDALSLSATDVFAAGFQDQKLGVVVGTSSVTGGAGAQTTPHQQLCRLFEEDDGAIASGVPLEFLPTGVGMAVALRRLLRVSGDDVAPIEGVGVTPDARYTMTRRDLLEGNPELIRFAMSTLRATT